MDPDQDQALSGGIYTGDQGTAISPPAQTQPQAAGAMDTSDNSGAPPVTAPGAQQPAQPDPYAIGPAPVSLQGIGQSIGNAWNQGVNNLYNSGPAQLMRKVANTPSDLDTPASQQTSLISKLLAGEGAVHPDVLDQVVKETPGAPPSDKLVN